MKQSPAQLLKNEIMERYGLKADQISLELIIRTEDVSLGRQILADFDEHPINKEYLTETSTADFAFGTEINTVWIHKKEVSADAKPRPILTAIEQ